MVAGRKVRPEVLGEDNRVPGRYCATAEWRPGNDDLLALITRTVAPVDDF
jgi:hypothetical protein